MDKFLEEYRLTDEDIIMIEDEGSTDRFANVDHAVFESNLDIFKDGVQFIDSPGLGEAVSRTKTTNKFIPQANAIVFLLDAQHLFSNEEKKFIRIHFVNTDPKPTNVFFLVNRMNQLSSDADRESVKRQTMIMLKGVFTNENGFDQELYDNRVFFGNSYGALQMQIEGKNPVGTGIPEFKTALEEFLTSEERVIAKYKSVVANIAGVYLIADKQLKENTALLKKDVSVLEANRDAANSKLDELKKSISVMERIVETSKKNIVNKVLTSLETFVKVDLINDWASYAEKYDDKFGITDMIKLAMPIGVSEKSKEEILTPMTEFINGYVEDKIQAWSEGIPMLIADDIKNMQEELDDKEVGFTLQLNSARAIFIGADTTGWKENGANKLQLALSLIQGDISVAVENNAGGNFTWGEFFKKYLVQGIINILVASLVGGGIPGLIAFAVIEIVQMGLRANSARNKLLNRFADNLFPKIGEKLLENSSTISNDIAVQFDQQKDDITLAARSLIEDEKQYQNNIIEQAKMKKDEIESEERRQLQILTELYNRTNLIYQLLFDRELEISDMERVAAMAKTDEVK